MNEDVFELYALLLSIVPWPLLFLAYPERSVTWALLYPGRGEEGVKIHTQRRRLSVRACAESQGSRSNRATQNSLLVQYLRQYSSDSCLMSQTGIPSLCKFLNPQVRNFSMTLFSIILNSEPTFQIATRLILNYVWWCRSFPTICTFHCTFSHSMVILGAFQVSLPDNYNNIKNLPYANFFIGNW